MSFIQKPMLPLAAAAAVAVTCGVSVAQASTLTSVPMQGGMVMPMLAYHADHGQLRVTMPPEVPQLTPLLVSNPSDHFDPADPWYDALDPSREGLAFSRRYGFVMDTATDPLPEGTGIVIRKVSGSPEAGFYRAHAMSLPHLWQPLFGTEGTTNTFAWSGSMFHPCVTAPPGTNAYSATFEAFLVTTNTGVAIPDSGTGTFVLNWTSVPDGRPTVDIAVRMVIAWPADAVTWALEWADTVPSANWTPVTNAPVKVDGQPAVVLDGSASKKFFRMRRTP
jgi:hypothetical protein